MTLTPRNSQAQSAEPAAGRSMEHSPVSHLAIDGELLQAAGPPPAMVVQEQRSPAQTAALAVDQRRPSDRFRCGSRANQATRFYTTVSWQAECSARLGPLTVDFVEA